MLQANKLESLLKKPKKTTYISKGLLMRLEKIDKLWVMEW